MKKIIHHALSH